MISRVNSSQELCLHTVNADQAYHSPQWITPASSSLAPSTPCRSDAIETTHVAYAAGGSNSIMPAAIVCPEVRKRSDWAQSLQSTVTPYTLSSKRLTLPIVKDGARSVLRVRYIADRFDREWMRAKAEYFRGSSNIIASQTNTSTLTSVNDTAPLTHDEDHYICALENIFTALELAAAHASPSTPIEQLNIPDTVHDRCRAVSVDFRENIRRYWVMKRHAMIKHVSIIPELASLRRDHTAEPLLTNSGSALEDCPLPFRARDWRIPVVQRTTSSSACSSPCSDHFDTRGGTAERRRRHRCGCPLNRCTCMQDEIDERQSSGHRNKCASWKTAFSLVATAQSVSESVLRREEFHLKHLDLSLYELAALRDLGSNALAEKEACLSCCSNATEEQLATPLNW